ncbi:unknown [Eggerthella sp. CAG:1427]|nr:unknown [Eggerthella sp. CAG:1427]
MYFLAPNGSILQDSSRFQSTDLPMQDRFLPGKSYDDVPWEWTPSDEFSLEDFNVLLELALRFGEPIRSGLIIDDRYVATYYQLREMQQNQASRNPEIFIAAAKEIDKLFPGYAEDSKQIEHEATESVNAQIEEKRAAFSKILDDNPKSPRLLKHWTALGGNLPR